MIPYSSNNQGAISTSTSLPKAGWAFRGATPSQCICGAVWAHGTHNQSTPLGQPQAGEQWWPCIILRAAGPVVPFYCPALAWMGARPWKAHVTRVRCVPWEGSQTPVTYVDIPGPHIEEVSSDTATYVDTPGPHTEEVSSDASYDSWTLVVTVDV